MIAPNTSGACADIAHHRTDKECFSALETPHNLRECAPVGTGNPKSCTGADLLCCHTQHLSPAPFLPCRSAPSVSCSRALWCLAC